MTLISEKRIANLGRIVSAGLVIIVSDSIACSAASLGLQTYRRTVGASQAASAFSNGSALSDALLQRCPILLGTLQEVTPPQQPVKDQGRSRSYSKVTIRVDEWLYAQPEKWAPIITLAQVPFNARPTGTESWGYLWRNTRVSQNAKIIVAFPPNEVGLDKELTTVSHYKLVVSDESLFQPIRDTILDHMRCLRDPYEIQKIVEPSLLESNAILEGYVIRYLWSSGGRVNPDADAPAISRLIAESQISDGSKRVLEPSLIRSVSNPQQLLFITTRRQVVETLLKPACRDDLELAKRPVRALVLITVATGMDISEYVPSSCRQTLLRNYRYAVPPNSIDGQRTFELQMKL